MTSANVASTTDVRTKLLLAALPKMRKNSAGTQPQGLMARLAEAAGCDVDEIARDAFDLFGVRAYSRVAIAALTPDFGKLSFSDCMTQELLVAFDDGTSKVAVDDPWDDHQRQWLINRLGGAPQLVWADRESIRQALARAEGRLQAMRSRGTPPPQGDGTPAEVDADQVVAKITLDSIERTSSPVVRFVDAAIYDAWKSGASDIHFEGSRTGLRVMLRLDGVLVEAARMDELSKAEEVISRLKVLSQLDITERRVPQDGRFRVRLGDREVDFRVSIMPSLHGEDAVLRLLDKTRLRVQDAGDGATIEPLPSTTISLEGLGFDHRNLASIRRLSRRPSGMLLVTGPTGSGKTTTLYAVIQEIHTGQDKIITIEDPVEYELEGILQIPVNEKKGLTFARGLRSILRHDPDKILVGEIRDPETADIAIQAALTGHLVFTTVHANNVYDVVGRFLHMDVDLYSFMSALNGVVAQRLLRLNCQNCIEIFDLKQSVVRTVDMTRFGLGDPEHWRMARGRGCSHCRGTGYKGRLAIAEVLTVDDELRSMVVRRAAINEIKAHGEMKGTEPIIGRALQLVANGRTTFEEVDRVVGLD